MVAISSTCRYVISILVYPSGGRTLSLNTGFSTTLDYHSKAILTKQADIVTTHGK